MLIFSDRKPYTKEYLPGYTGHVPQKDELFGMTTGEVNRFIILNNGIAGFPKPLGSTHTERYYRPATTPTSKPSKDIFGNWSRYAKNWIAGPTHQV